MAVSSVTIARRSKHPKFKQPDSSLALYEYKVVHFQYHSQLPPLVITPAITLKHLAGLSALVIDGARFAKNTWLVRLFRCGIDRLSSTDFDRGAHQFSMLATKVGTIG